MIVKVGYIGSKQSVSRIRELANEILGIKVYTYTYESPEDVSELHAQAVREVDVVCFSGIVSYFYRDQTLDRDCETVVSPFHEYMVAASLLSATVNHSVTVNQLSLDMPDKRFLDKVEHDISFSIKAKHVYDYHWIYKKHSDQHLSVADIISFHKDLYETGQTKLAITSIHYVYDKLNWDNIPAIYMVDHDTNMKRVLEEAKQRVLFSWLQDGMITVIYFALKNGYMTTSDQSLITEQIQSMISQPVNTHGDCKKTVGFYTTRGAVEDSFLPQVNKSWLKKLKAKLSKTFYFGIGYGRELFEAEEHAKQALLSAQMEEECNGYLLTDQKELIGPIAGATTYDHIRTNEEWLLELINQTKTTLKTMQRFIDFVQINQYQPFTVRELSAFSNVTVRTSERFIKRLYDSGVVVIDGQEQNYSHGRPRKVYALVEDIESKFRSIVV